MATTERHVHDNMDAPSDSDTSVTGLLSRLANDVSELTRGEMQLARAEISQSVNDAKTGVISLAAGAIVLLTGLPILLASLAFGIAGLTGIPLWVSFLVVGLIVAGIGAIMLKTAGSKLSAENMSLSRTASSLEKDARLVKEQAQ